MFSRVLIALCALSLPAHAYEETWQAQLPATRTWVVIHGENDRHFVVDTFKQTRGELQDLVKSRAFANLSEAKQFAHQERNRLAPQTQWRFVNESSRDSAEALTSSFNEEVAAPPLPPIWEVKEQWSWEWEQKYAQWIRENVTTTFFLDHRIATDCADVAFALRWIFSRIHGLPAANHLVGSGDIFTHASNQEDWLALPTTTEWHQDQRFRAALNYLLRNTSTHTLSRDTYPIALTQEALIEGTIRLYIHTVSGHTQVWGRVDRTGELPVEALESTTPRALRALQRGLFTSQPPVKSEGGLMRPLWAEITPQGWGLRLPLEMPHFSEEQYDPTIIPEDADFTLMLLQRVNPAFHPGRIVEATMTLIDTMIEQRIEVVKQGYSACQTQDCSPGTPGWDAWSTPTRDTRLREAFHNGRVLTQQSAIPEITKSRWKHWLNHKKFIIEGHETHLALIYWLSLNKVFLSDPRIEPVRRWNLNPRGFLENHLGSWRSSWLARQARALNPENPCTSSPEKESLNCSPGGASYKTWDTSQEDNQLAGQFEGILATRNLYLDEASQAEWNLAFQSILETQASQHEWRQRVFLLNSDPRATQARRQGDPIPELSDILFRERHEDQGYESPEVIWRDDKRLVESRRSLSTQKKWPFTYTLTNQRIRPFLPELASSQEWVIAPSATSSSPPLFAVTGPSSDRAIARLYDLDENLLAEVTLPLEASPMPPGKFRAIQLNPLDPYFGCTVWENASAQPELTRFLVDFRTGTATSVKDCIIDQKGPPVVALQNSTWALINRTPDGTATQTPVLPNSAGIQVSRALTAEGGTWIQLSSAKTFWLRDGSHSPIEIQDLFVGEDDSLFHTEGTVFIQLDVDRKNIWVFEINPETGHAQVLQHLAFANTIGFNYYKDRGAVVTNAITNEVRVFQWKEKTFHEALPEDPKVTIHSAPNEQGGRFFYFFGRDPNKTHRLYRWDSTTTELKAISPAIAATAGGTFGFLRSTLTVDARRVLVTIGDTAWLVDVTNGSSGEWGTPLLTQIRPVVSSSHRMRFTAHMSRWTQIFYTGIPAIDQSMEQNVLTLWRQASETPAH